MKKYIINGFLRWFTSKANDHRGKTQHEKSQLRKMKPSKLQGLVQDRFRDAASYAKAQMLDPEMKAMYATRINYKMQLAYVVALSDALHAPTVKRIDNFDYKGNAGDKLPILATAQSPIYRKSSPLVRIYFYRVGSLGDICNIVRIEG